MLEINLTQERKDLYEKHCKEDIQEDLNEWRRDNWREGDMLRCLGGGEGGRT